MKSFTNMKEVDVNVRDENKIVFFEDGNAKKITSTPSKDVGCSMVCYINFARNSF